jgi:hypothetical protein
MGSAIAEGRAMATRGKGMFAWLTALAPRDLDRGLEEIRRAPSNLPLGTALLYRADATIDLTTSPTRPPAAARLRRRPSQPF